RLLLRTNAPWPPRRRPSTCGAPWRRWAAMPERFTISLTVNGQPFQRTVESRLLLSDFLRHELRLTGTHVGCEHGVCRACTVLVDGAPVRSCLMLAVQVNAHELSTVEGLSATAGKLHPIQEAMRDHHGLQ